jgi:hypothetical protein
VAAASVRRGTKPN